MPSQSPCASYFFAPTRMGGRVMGMAKSTFQGCSDEGDFLHTLTRPRSNARCVLCLCWSDLPTATRYCSTIPLRRAAQPSQGTRPRIAPALHGASPHFFSPLVVFSCQPPTQHAHPPLSPVHSISHSPSRHCICLVQKASEVAQFLPAQGAGLVHTKSQSQTVSLQSWLASRLLPSPSPVRLFPILQYSSQGIAFTPQPPASS